MIHIAALSVVGCAVVSYLYVSLPHSTLSHASRRRALASTIRTLGALAWPTILFSSVPSEDRSHLSLSAALAWHSVVWGIDAYLVRNSPSKDADHVASLKLEPSSLFALSFGLSGLLGTKPDSRYTHLFLYAVVGCFLAVLPSHNLQPGCIEEQLFEGVQKAVLMWCIGLLVAGVALSRSRMAEMTPTPPSSLLGTGTQA